MYLEVIEDFSKKNTVPVLWPEPRFIDNIAVTHVTKTMVSIFYDNTKNIICLQFNIDHQEPGQLLGPGQYNVVYIAMDASRNEATCSFIIEVKGKIIQ